MANNLRDPRNVQSTSTRESLKHGPADMPDRGGSKPNVQTTSSQIPLSRNPMPVAAFTAHPNQGSVQSTGSQVNLNRSASMPYEPMSRTKPQTPFGGKGKK